MLVSPISVERGARRSRDAPEPGERSETAPPPPVRGQGGWTRSVASGAQRSEGLSVSAPPAPASRRARESRPNPAPPGRPPPRQRPFEPTLSLAFDLAPPLVALLALLALEALLALALARDFLRRAAFCLRSASYSATHSSR